MRYKILSSHVVYGGIPEETTFYEVKTNQLLDDCIKFIKSKTDAPFDLNIWIKTKEDSMGCYTRYKVIEDKSVDTIFSELTLEEKRELFSHAISWIQNEMAIPSELLIKIQEFE